MFNKISNNPNALVRILGVGNTKVNKIVTLKEAKKIAVSNDLIVEIINPNKNPPEIKLV